MAENGNETFAEVGDVFDRTFNNKDEKINNLNDRLAKLRL